MKLTTKEIQKIVATTLPEGRVVAAHTKDEHFYEIHDADTVTYPSATKRLSCLKDPSLNNFKMNEALTYVFTHFRDFTPENIMHHIAEAEKAPSDISEDAGDVGTEIHNVREKYFNEWINTGIRPIGGAVSFIEEDMGMKDIRIVSAMRALDLFIDTYKYEPIITELKVFSHKLKTGGTLDDVGWLYLPIREGNPECKHDYLGIGCSKCDYKVEKVLALVDLKSSNQIKFYFAYQVALYYLMFKEITGIKLDKFYILKVNKLDGSYLLQEIKNMFKVCGYAKSIIEIDEGNEMIKESFKKQTFKI